MTNAECHKKANIDKKLLPKINSDKHYKTKKTATLSLAIGLELDLGAIQEL